MCDVFGWVEIVIRGFGVRIIIIGRYASVRIVIGEVRFDDGFDVECDGVGRRVGIRCDLLGVARGNVARSDRCECSIVVRCDFSIVSVGGD